MFYTALCGTVPEKGTKLFQEPPWTAPKKQNIYKELGPEKSPCYNRYLIISDLFIMSFHCTLFINLNFEDDNVMCNISICLVCLAAYSEESCAVGCGLRGCCRWGSRGAIIFLKLKETSSHEIT